MTYLISINEKPRKDKGAGAHQEYTREFELHWSDGLATGSLCADAAWANFGIKAGEGHPDNLFAKAYNESATQRDDVCFWDLVVDYKTFGLSAYEREQWTQPDPTLRKPRVSMGWENLRVAVPDETPPDGQLRGALITNSAGQVPQKRVEIDANTSGYHIVANVYPLPDWLDTYCSDRRGVINSTAFRIQLQSGQYKTVAKGCGRLVNARASDLKEENGFPYFEVNCDILLQSPPDMTDEEIAIYGVQDGWVWDMVDQGRMEKVGSIDSAMGLRCPLQPIIGQDGQPVSDEWLLDGRGFALTKSLGDFDNSEAYAIGNVVTVDGVDYIATEQNPASPTSVAPPDDGFWQRLPIRFFKNVYRRKPFHNVLPACFAVS